MKHTSISLGQPLEFIDVVPVNPLISKCQIKVCYVGDEPNRNKSVITKDVAREMANSLPGSPIVGFYNENKNDFEEHNRSIDISNGEFKITDTTKPYGFVDLNAKVWFEKFQDDGMNEHEYLMTEGWLWTGQYPECQRILEHGNNQSMELDEKNLDASWTFDDNGIPQFFIINEAIISKLCILGEDCEPCFEGSQIAKVQFSFEDGFKDKLFSMMSELTELLNKGGTQVFTTYSVQVGDAVWTALYSHIVENYSEMTIDGIFEDDNQKYAILKNAEGKFSRLNFELSEEGVFTAAEQLTEVDESYSSENSQFSLEEVEQFIANFKKTEDKDEQEDTSENEDSQNTDSSEEDKKDDEEESEKDKKAKYILAEIPEYTELMNQYNSLEENYNLLIAERDSLKTEIESLTAFKVNIERKQKQDMIDSFYVLSEEDKADVIKNMDSYSLEQIEEKLSVICVRNRVSWNDNSASSDATPMTYSLGSNIENNNDSVPAWIKVVSDVAKTLN